MKPGERPPASPPNDGRLLDGTLGSDPVHQDRPHHGLDLSTLAGATVTPKPLMCWRGGGRVWNGRKEKTRSAGLAKLADGPI